MKKQIRQITGTSIGITFTKEEQKIYNLAVGVVIEIEPNVIKNKGKKK